MLHSIHMDGDLTKELQTYQAHREQLLQKAKGRFVLIKGDAIIGDFGSYDDALSQGYARFGNAVFLVKEVKEDETVNSFSRPLPV